MSREEPDVRAQVSVEAVHEMMLFGFSFKFASAFVYPDPEKPETWLVNRPLDS